jgi:O-antigen/teichoic acid export membrane protein
MTGSKKKAILGNTVWTIAGALVLNGVLQLFIYPRLNAEMGAEAIGTVLYITGLVSILGPSVGQALNTSRLVVRRGHDVSNGDYDRTILLFTAVGIAAALLISTSSISGIGSYILTAVLILITVFRYYGDVEYRLSLNYKRYFVYYLAAGLGYLAGYFLYRFTGNWFFIFLTGEAAALIYVSAKGTVFRNFFRTSPNFRIVLSRGALLVMSYTVTNLTLNIDRLVLKNTLGGTAVTQYYVVSLIGKTLVLFIAPINTIIISYLTKEKVYLSAKRFMEFAGIGLLVSALFFLVCQAVTPWFVGIFYPDLAESVSGLVMTVNLTQILAMLSAYLFIIVLTFTDEKWQLILQCAHLALLAVLIILMIGNGIAGFAAAVLIANAARVAAVLILGMINAGKRKEICSSEKS